MHFKSSNGTGLANPSAIQYEPIFMRVSPTILLASLIMAAAPDIASAHSGGLNSQGCHTNRKTGDYHCHRAPSGAMAAPLDHGPTRVDQLDASGTANGAFRNCTEARAAGAAPVRRGDPGYGPHLDRDNDGVGCE